MNQKSAKSLPVVMYHYVNNSGEPLAISPEGFDSHCATLVKEGWKGISLEEAENFFLYGEPIPSKSVLITFDDGYLDNYVNAWPILEKYGHKGVVFATAAYLGGDQKLGRSGPRPTLKDVWSGAIAKAALPDVNSIINETPFGKVINNHFFTWEEARRMEASGVMAIGAHSLFHDGVFTSPQYEGFHQPGDFLISLNKEVRGAFWGRPLFSRGAFLGERSFIPSELLLKKIKTHVPQDAPQTQNFFLEKENLQFLHNLVENHGEPLGRMETDSEWRERIFTAMRDNQDILISELGHPVKSFCWPWGVGSPLAVEAGQAAGFSVFYGTKKGVNPPQKPLAINRMNFRSNPHKQVKRLTTYAHPLWGNVYEWMREGTKHLRSAIRKT